MIHTNHLQNLLSKLGLEKIVYEIKIQCHTVFIKVPFTNKNCYMIV